MSDGTGKSEREQSRTVIERLISQRNAARKERDRLRGIVEELVRLKDGPRDDAYRVAKDRAWQNAREARGHK